MGSGWSPTCSSHTSWNGFGAIEPSAHVRYSTFGTSILKNVQPLVVDYAHGSMALGHNGNLVNAARLRDELEEAGALFQSTTDSEVIIQLIARAKHPRFAECVMQALKQVVGAYSVLATNGEEIVAAREPVWLPAAVDRAPGRHVRLCQRDLRAGYHRRGVGARD